LEAQIAGCTAQHRAGANSVHMVMDNMALAAAAHIEEADGRLSLQSRCV